MLQNHPLWIAWLVLLGVLVPVSARAQPAWGAWDEVEPDRVAPEAHGSSWLTLSGFTRLTEGARADVGGLAVVGLALDRIAANGGRGRAAAAARGALLAATTSSWAAPAAVTTTAAAAARLPVTAAVARAAVVAAWRATGLGKDDAALDAVLARARASTLLPELRLRAMRVLGDTERVDDPAAVPSPTSSSGWDTTRTSLWLEARATWRLDRLLYVDEEITAERLRIDRSETRARVAMRVLAELASWQRAWLDQRGAPADSPDATDAQVRMNEAEAALDVLTAGWFSAWRARSALAAEGG